MTTILPGTENVPLVTWQHAALLGDAPILVTMLVVIALRIVFYSMNKQTDNLPGRTRRRVKKPRGLSRGASEPRSRVLGHSERPRQRTRTSHCCSRRRRHGHAGTSSLVIVPVLVVMSVMAYVVSSRLKIRFLIPTTTTAILHLRIGNDGSDVIDIDIADVIVGVISAIGGCATSLGMGYLMKIAKRRHRRVLWRCRPTAIKQPRESPRLSSLSPLFEDTCSWRSPDVVSLVPSTMPSVPSRVDVSRPPSLKSTSAESTTHLHALRNDSVSQCSLKLTVSDDVMVDVGDVGDQKGWQTARAPSTSMTASPSPTTTTTSLMTPTTTNSPTPTPATTSPSPPTTSTPGIDEVAPLKIPELSMPNGQITMPVEYLSNALSNSPSPSSSMESILFSDGGGDVLDLLESPILPPLPAPLHPKISNNNNNNINEDVDDAVNDPNLSAVHDDLVLNYVIVVLLTLFVVASVGGMVFVHCDVIGAPIHQLHRWMVGWTIAVIVTITIVLPIHVIASVIKYHRQTLSMYSVTSLV